MHCAMYKCFKDNQAEAFENNLHDSYGTIHITWWIVTSWKKPRARRSRRGTNAEVGDRTGSGLNRISEDHVYIISDKISFACCYGSIEPRHPEPLKVGGVSCSTGRGRE